MWMIQQAAERRNRGFHTGKSAAGWNVKRAQPVKGSWDATVIEAKSRWDVARVDAIMQFQFAVYGDPLEGFELGI